MNPLALFGKKLLFFDGAMGTLLQQAGLAPGEAPDGWSVTHPEAVQAIHRDYLRAGCHILTTNTLGCNDYKLADAGVPFGAAEIAARAVANAREAIRAEGETAAPRFVALDIGPTGKLLQPLGDLGFEAAVELFKTPILAGAQAGADMILIETLSDTYELKAAVLAAKEAALPVCATVTVDARGKLLTGGDLPAVAALLEGLGVDALGLNCSLGPEEMLPHLDVLLARSSLPLIFTPNAGLPRAKDGRACYDLTPEAFALAMEKAAWRGAWLLGGCCGTTPAHIAAMTARLGGLMPPPVTKKHLTVASSYARAVDFGGRAVLIGERINPTGKPRLKQALREEDYDYILTEGVKQQAQGAQVLDVNAGLPELDEAAALTAIVTRLQSVTDLPLQLDTADHAAMEKALRLYNGKAVINSVTGKARDMEAIFPLVKRYGAVIVALTLDEGGIPDTVEGRLAIARRILARAADYGIEKEAFLFDPLTMTVSAEQAQAALTLDCVRRLKRELGVKTSLGVSNVSFGLPRRELLNAAFLTLTLGAGLDAAILNPCDARMREAYHAANVLLGYDAQCAGYIAAYAGEAAAQAPPAAALTLGQAILHGLRGDAAVAARSALQHTDPLQLIEGELAPALNVAGERFEAGTLYLPQLLMCAEAAKAAFEVIRAAMGEGTENALGTVVLATVQGDVHDIGKNIVRALLENYRFRVIDLGRDVPPARVVEAAREHGAKLVGLSALMTTTVPAMAQTVKLLKAELPDCKVLCGGAVLTEDYVLQMGADAYARDAMATVRYAQSAFALRFRTNG